jgi:glycosyltransferase involved in cell wall biosynthesis
MITYCIPSKNNLRYLKSCIPSIQQFSHYKNDILVYVDQDNDGTVEWLKENNIDHIVNTDPAPKGIGYAYDTMFAAAKTDLVVAFHADMILGQDADLHLVKHHKRGNVVCSTRIEPPLHPPGPEKIVKDFGLWPEDLDWNAFDRFVRDQIEQKKDVYTNGLFAPWLIHKEDHLGHDEIFLSVYEDADLFRRFKLAGYDTIQSWSSYVYHLTCRGGQFEHAKEDKDFSTKSQDWEIKNYYSLLEYIRKWGGMFKEDGPCVPKPNKKYDIGLEITNCTDEILNIEPFVNNLSVDIEAQYYIEVTQPISKFDIASKFVSALTNDIVIKLDVSIADLQEFNYLVYNIEDILEEIDVDSAYEIGNGIQLLIYNKLVRNPKIKL